MIEEIKSGKLKEKIWKYFWVVSFFFQFCLFYSYCEREIIGYIPVNIDQVGYMGVSYKIYDLVLRGDIAQSIAYAYNNGVNSGMMLIGAINLFVFGFSRISLLIPNFLGLFMCELIGARSLDRIYNSKSIGLIYCGLLLMTQAIFASVGGMFDYRWDFLAFCLYTMWLIYLVEYLHSDRKYPFFCSAIAGGVLLYIRLNTVLYLGVILLIIAILRIIRQKKDNRKECFTMWCKYLGIVFLAGGWYLLLSFDNFFNYYFSALFTSSAREAWKIHMGMKDNLLFYPQVLWTALMGSKQILLVGALSVIAIIVLLFGKKLSIKRRMAFFSLLISCIIPYTILTIMDNKNSAASMILIGPLLIFPVFLLGEAFAEGTLKRLMVQTLSVVVIVLGGGVFSLNIMSAYPYQTKEDAQDYVCANEVIAEYMDENDMDSAEIIFDRLLGSFFPQTVQIYSREEKGRDISLSYAIPSMKEDYLMSTFGSEEIQMGLENAHFLVLNKAQYATESVYSTDRILQENKDLLLRYAKENMHMIGEVTCAGEQLVIYAKPITTIQTQWDDWLGEDNTDIIIKNVKEDESFLVLEGEYGYPLRELGINVKNSEGKVLSSDFLVDGSKYKIVIDISECVLEQDIIHIYFESYFVPSEVLGSQDTRRLSVRYPSEMYFE